MEGNVRLLRAKVQNGELTEAEATAMLGKSPMEAQGKIPKTIPTPLRNMGSRSSEGFSPNLNDYVKSWPTPDTQNHRDGSYRRKDSNLEQGGRHGVSLHHAVTAFPTPSAADNRDRGSADTPAIQRRIEKGKQVMLSMRVQQTSGEVLHGRWTLALMGYPPNWCDLDGQTELGS